ncbi:YraN family protein [Acetobacter pomorum]|nr:YraN family protein [Acetobacter pomorum]
MIDKMLTQNGLGHKIPNKVVAKQKPTFLQKQQSGRVAYTQGIAAEEQTCHWLEQEGWTVLLRRARTRRGEIDIVASKAAVLCFVEVKKRRSIEEALISLQPAQQRRLFRAAECLLQKHPYWHYEEIRFDLFVFDDVGRMERLEDIIRQT